MTIKQATQNGFNVEVSHFRLRYEDFKKVNDYIANFKKNFPFISGDLINYVNYERVLSLLGINYVPRPEFQHGEDISPRGGQTQVVIEKNGKKSVGISYCYFTDNFSRAEGISVALKRAMEDYHNRIHI